MPSNEIAKTKSAPNRWALAVAVTGVILFAVISIGLACYLWVKMPAVRVLRVAQQVYTLQVADTPESQNKGLGRRASMPQNVGMVFVYAAAEPQRCFWMKDMHFSLDIIWLDASKKVVHLERNASPSDFPKQYCPTEAAQYVIELSAGQAAHANIQVGDQLHF